MLNRRELLQSAAVAAPGLLLNRLPSPPVRRPPADVAGMNVVLFISDQERAVQHFPRGWTQRHLPGLTRLQNHGVTFDSAFCNACMCSPSRATMFTGYFPAQHGVKYTLEEDMPADQYPQVELPLDLGNLGSVLSAAGYNVVYKGKWHLSKPAGDQWAPSDVDQYGFQRWNPPDAGANQDIPQEGGGIYDNDGRYMNEDGDPASGHEGALDFLRSAAAQLQPFFLVVSLVNPHDVLMYPRKYLDAGYDDDWLQGDVGLPRTVAEDLSTKPTAQEQFLRLFNLSGALRTPAQKRAYINFYANLMKVADGYLVDVLNTLTLTNLLDNTLVIRTSDHGEMGTAHGGLRQKNFNFYEETLRVPLVYSNPKLFRRPRTERAMVSHVDLLPTLAGLLAAPRADWKGHDYSGLVLGRSASAVQDHVVFTYDDFQAGQARGPYVRPPQHIVSIRERRFKLARYHDPAGNVPDQWEMYDLLHDPLERRNLAFEGHRRTPAQERHYDRLRRRLARVERTQLAPLPARSAA